MNNIPVHISNTEAFTNVLGWVMANNQRYFVAAGILCRKSAMDFILPSLHAGQGINTDKQHFLSLGKKRYVAKKGLADGGIARAMILPSAYSVRDGESEDDDADAQSINTVLWYNVADPGLRIWSHIRTHTPIPVLDVWREPVMDMLRDTDMVDQLRVESGFGACGYDRLAPVEFAISDGLWGGVMVRADDDDIGLVTRHLLKIGKLHITH